MSETGKLLPGPQVRLEAYLSMKSVATANKKKLNSLSCQRNAHEKLLITSTPFIAQKAFAHVPFL